MCKRLLEIIKKAQAEKEKPVMSVSDCRAQDEHVRLAIVEYLEGIKNDVTILQDFVGGRGKIKR